jgi:hypothetical protein
LPLILRESEIFFFSSLNLFIWNLGSSTSFSTSFLFIYFLLLLYLLLL